MQRKNNQTLAELFNLPKNNGRLFMPKGERVAGCLLAPVLIAFFSYVRTELVSVIGNGTADIAVRIFLEEMYLVFILFTGLAWIWCLFRPLWIERLLDFSVRKLVFLFQIIVTAPIVLLIMAIIYNFLPH
ncbi:MAG: hypothetical protein U1F83_12050 [Verrucomicrobiota bacterium]